MSLNHFDTIALATGQRVYAPVSIIDRNELIALQMLGPQESVKANWAALMSNKRSHYYINANGFGIKGKENHLILRKLLPSGWLEMWLIHHQATITHMNPNGRFYLIEHNGRRPNFYLYLNKALAAPLLPSWANHLLNAGTHANLITPLPQSYCKGATATAVNPKAKSWHNLIQHGLRTNAISLTA